MSANTDDMREAVLSVVLAMSREMGARIRERELRERREYNERMIRERGLTGDMARAYRRTAIESIKQGRSYSFGELSDELMRYIEERAQAGENRDDIIAELFAEASASNAPGVGR